jgi:hypothetical protein
MSATRWLPSLTMDSTRNEMRELIKNFVGLPNTKYSELSTYLTALACAVILFTHPDFRQSLALLVQGLTANGKITDIIGFLVLGLIVISGFVLSLYHVFTTRKKTSFEKYCMGVFAIVANAAAAVTACVEEIVSGSYILIFFPLWNILMGIVLIFRIRPGKFEVTDENASLLEVSGNSIALLAVFAITNYAFHLSWAMAFSICLFYSSFLVFLIALIFKPAFLRSSGRQNQDAPARRTKRLRTSSPVKGSPFDSKTTMSLPMVACPHCKVRVLPKQDGTCPSCQAKISG